MYFVAVHVLKIFSSENLYGARRIFFLSNNVQNLGKLVTCKKKEFNNSLARFILMSITHRTCCSFRVSIIL